MGNDKAVAKSRKSVAEHIQKIKRAVSEHCEKMCTAAEGHESSLHQHLDRALIHKTVTDVVTEMLKARSLPTLGANIGKLSRGRELGKSLEAES